MNVGVFSRPILLALEMSIGALLAASAGTAWADSSSDWLALTDSLAAASVLPAAPSGVDLAVSFDGYPIIQLGSATAQTVSGEYGMAIAEGSGSYAFAGGGIGDVAEAEGVNAFALAGGAPGDTGGDFNTAIDIGNNALPSTGARDGAYAGNGDLGGGTGIGAHNVAIDIGNNTNDPVTGGGNEGAFAGAGALVGDSGDGYYNTAIDIGNNSNWGDGADAFGGTGNYASDIGNMSGYSEGAYAGLGDHNTAIADTNYTEIYGGVYAVQGNDNTVFVVGPQDSYAAAFDGDSNSSYVVDPFGSTTSFAETGYGHSSDLAALLYTDGGAVAVNADSLYDIATVLGHATGTF